MARGCHEADLAVRLVRGHKSRAVDGLFDEFAAALQFPYYFGANWAAARPFHRSLNRPLVPELHAASQQSSYICMSTKREKCPWNATVMVSVGPLRCLATMRSASPARGDSFS